MAASGTLVQMAAESCRAAIPGETGTRRLNRKAAAFLRRRRFSVAAAAPLPQAKLLRAY